LLRFHDSSSVLLVAWLDNIAGETETVNLNSLPLSAVNFKGGPAAITQTGPSTWSVSIGNSPVYLVFPHRVTGAN
jgi:hypothetical protein